MNQPKTKSVAVVVNDDPIQLNVLAGFLGMAGIQARSFESAETALATVNPADPPDLLVTDLYMPGIDGWRFCRLLRSPEYAAFNKLPILVVSATFADFLERIGYTREDLLKLTPRDIAPDDAFKDLAKIRANIASTGTTLFEIVHLSSDGRRIPVESHVRVLELDGQRVAVSVVRNLSERKRAEETIQRRIKYRRCEAECIAILAGLESPDAMLSRVAFTLRVAAGADRVYVFRHEEDAAGEPCMTQTHESCAAGIEPQIANPDLQRLPYRLGAPSLLPALRSRKAIKSVVSAMDGLEQEILAAQGIVSLLILPIFQDGDLWGFIGLDDCQTPRDWSDDGRLRCIGGGRCLH